MYLLAIGLPVNLPVPSALQGREGNGPGHPMRIGLGSREPWILLARDMGALAALRGREGKGPEPPGTWGPFGGPQGAPGPFPSRSAALVINPPGESGALRAAPVPPGAPLKLQGHGGPRALRGAPRGLPEGSLEAPRRRGPPWRPPAAGLPTGPRGPPGPARGPPGVPWRPEGLPGAAGARGSLGPPGCPQGPLGDPRVRARIPRAPEVAPRT